MKKIIYFFEFIFIIILFFIFKILGLKFSRFLSKNIFKTLGPIFRSEKMIKENIKNSIVGINDFEVSQIIESMWSNYGKIFAEYMFLNKFRSNNNKYIQIEGLEILNYVKKSNHPFIFISGHFDNFELMAMVIEKSGVKLSAIYRPLNNIFLNQIMVYLRKKYICRNQITKGISGTRESIKFLNQGYSLAMMIDQRLTEGTKIKFFEREASTTTLPSQFFKKYGTQIIPIYINRIEESKFKITINEPLKIDKNESEEKITLMLNKWLEKQILKNPSQWIWSHNRWK